MLLHLVESTGAKQAAQQPYWRGQSFQATTAVMNAAQHAVIQQPHGSSWH